MCSGRGISALLKLGPNLPKGDGSELVDGGRRQPVALVDVLAVPATGERLDDPGGLAAVPGERLVEAGAHRVVREALAGAGVVGELAAQVVVEGALRQAGEELARQCGEA